MPSVKTLAHPGDLLEVRPGLGHRIVDRPEEHPDQEPRDAAEEEKIHENGRERLRPVFVDGSDTEEYREYQDADSDVAEGPSMKASMTVAMAGPGAGRLTTW